jgi:hypothetical protein
VVFFFAMEWDNDVLLVFNMTRRAFFYVSLWNIS